MVNTILARRVNHNCSQRGQSCLAKRVKVAWLFQPHRKHLYQLMANELRIPHVTVSLVYMTVQGLVNGSAERGVCVVYEEVFQAACF